MKTRVDRGDKTSNFSSFAQSLIPQNTHLNGRKVESFKRIPLEPNDKRLGEVGLRRFSGEVRISGELRLVALRGPSLWTGEEAGLGLLKNVPLGGLGFLFVLNEKGIVALIG